MKLLPGKSRKEQKNTEYCPVSKSTPAFLEGVGLCRTIKDCPRRKGLAVPGVGLPWLFLHPQLQGPRWNCVSCVMASEPLAFENPLRKVVLKLTW